MKTILFCFIIFLFLGCADKNKTESKIPLPQNQSIEF